MQRYFVLFLSFYFVWSIFIFIPTSALASFVALADEDEIEMAETTSMSAETFTRIGRLKKIFVHQWVRYISTESDFSHIRYSVRFMGEGSSNPGLWYRLEGEMVAIPLGQDGEMNWEPGAALFRLNPPIFTNVGKDDWGILISVEVVLPKDKRDGQEIYWADDLRLSIKQINSATKKAAGVVFFVAPKFNEIILFAPDGEAPILHFKNGTTRPMIEYGEEKNGYIFNTKDRKLRDVDYISASHFLGYGLWH